MRLCGIALRALLPLPERPPLQYLGARSDRILGPFSSEAATTPVGRNSASGTPGPLVGDRRGPNPSGCQASLRRPGPVVEVPTAPTVPHAPDSRPAEALQVATVLGVPERGLEAKTMARCGAVGAAHAQGVALPERRSDTPGALEPGQAEIGFRWICARAGSTLRGLIHWTTGSLPERSSRFVRRRHVVAGGDLDLVERASCTRPAPDLPTAFRIRPRLAYTSHTASSTCSQVSYLASWVQIRDISGRA